ncbi:MAG: putative rane protein [Fibrobacteres bacterium]|nr:putative rane protein [Fibrobacterota bacterium]
MIKSDASGLVPFTAIAAFAMVGALLGRPAGAQTASSLAVPKVSFAYLYQPEHPSQARPRSGSKAGGDSLTLDVRVVLQDGWHINSEAPLDSFLVPTTLDIKADGIEFGKPRYPQPMIQKNQVMGDLSLFTGTFDVQVPAKRVRKSGAAIAPAGRTRVTLNYQSCNNTMCLPPKSVTVEGDTPPAN